VSARPDETTRRRRKPRAAGALAALVAEAAERNPRRLKAALGQEGFVLLEKDRVEYARAKSAGLGEKVRSPLEDADFSPFANKVVEDKRTFLDYSRLYPLFQAFQNVVSLTDENDPLELLEVGVYKGGSSYFLASLAHAYAPGRARLVSVDTFEGHSDLDLLEGIEGRHTPSTFSDTSVEAVQDYLSEFAFVEILKGRIQDVSGAIADRRLHLAHIDVDIYEPTAFTLDFLDERLVRGGVIVVDDYNFVTCPGVKRAVDSFCEQAAGRFFKLALDSGQCCLVAMA
jgi:hypothetical protein